jgi:hypothetical protein
MVTFEVATFGQVQGNQIGLEVIDGSAVVRSFALGCRREELSDLLLDGAERACQSGTVKDGKRFAHKKVLSS